MTLVSQSILSKLLSGERLDKALNLALGIFFISSVITLGYWTIDRVYNRFFVLVMNPLLLFAATLVFRLKLIEIRDKAEENAKLRHVELGLSLDEAINLFQYRDELRMMRDWITLVIVMTLVSLIISLVFPI